MKIPNIVSALIAATTIADAFQQASFSIVGYSCGADKISKSGSSPQGGRWASTSLYVASSADFQASLLELHKQGVQLLGCDANAVHTMNTGLWGTIADISENDEASKVCLVMEDIPQSAIDSFVQDFSVLTTQERLMEQLPEFRRLSVDLVEGGGPAIVIESQARTRPELNEKKERCRRSYDKDKCIASLKTFIRRIVIQESACPYTKSVDIAATGLEAKGVTPGPVAYRFSDAYDAARALSVFWECVGELLSTQEEEISTTMLALPAIGAGSTPESFKRFAAVMEVVGRYLCLFRGDISFGLVHFHPAYDRDNIHPVDRPAYGHLPPRSWLRPMMRMNGNRAEAEGLTDADLELSDYQRKAPFAAINILRVRQLNAASGPKSIVDLEVADGVFEKASGIPLYSRNAIRLARIGKSSLEAGLKADIAVFNCEDQKDTEVGRDSSNISVNSPQSSSAGVGTISRADYEDVLAELASLSKRLNEVETKLLSYIVKD